MYFSEFCVGPFNFTQLYLHIDSGEFLFLENWRFQGAESTLSAVWISIGTRTRPNCETLWTATDWTLCEVSTFLFNGITIRQSGSSPSQTSVHLICFIFYSNAVLYFAFVFCLLFSFSLHMRDYTRIWCTLTRVLNLCYYEVENTSQIMYLHKWPFIVTLEFLVCVCIICILCTGTGGIHWRTSHGKNSVCSCYSICLMCVTSSSFSNYPFQPQVTIVIYNCCIAVSLAHLGHMQVFAAKIVKTIIINLIRLF